MKINSFIYKLIAVNGLVAIFILGTYLTVNYFINTKIEDITNKKRVIKTIVFEVDKVNINLLKSATLKNNKYLVDSIKSSNEIDLLIKKLNIDGYDTKQLKSDYLEFFKYSVMTTSMFIENRNDEATKNNYLAEEKQRKLLESLNTFVKLLEQTQFDITSKIDFLMISSYIFLIFILIGNILYINYHFKLSKQRDEEIATMLETIGDGVYGVDSQGNCTFINQSALDMIQFSKKEILHNHQHYIFHHHKLDGSLYGSEDCPIFKTLVDKKTRVVKENFIKKDDTFLPVTLTVSPLKDRGAIVVFKDITEELNYERTLKDKIDEKTQELQELNNNLEKKIKEEIEKNKQQFMLLEQQSRLAALGEMIGNIAHQWRQPLSAITISMSGLHLKYELGIMTEEEMTQTKDSIIKNANYLSQTIDDFRNFIKNEHNEILFNISKVIDEVYSIVYPTMKNCNILIELNVDKDITYLGYPNELSQVILNILNNAKDAFKQRELEIKKIKIDLYRDDKNIYIQISDNAGGVPQEIRSKIFDPYFTTKHQSQGTGLGLYMSLKIITERFLGKLLYENNIMEIDNKKYEGAIFKIVLAPQQ